jgi:hypothetical protein
MAVCCCGYTVTVEACATTPPHVFPLGQQPIKPFELAGEEQT